MHARQITNLIGTAAQAAAPAAKLKKATQEIEAIFVKDLIAAMRKTSKHQALGSSLGGEMYQDMFDQAMSESASKSGTLGIAQTIYRQMAPQAIRAALRVGSVPLPSPSANARPLSHREQDALATREQDAPATRGLEARATTKP